MYICLCTLFFIGVCLIISGSAIFYVFLHSNQSYANIGLWMDIIGLMPIIIVWIIVTYLFNRKLFLLSIHCRPMQQHQTEPVIQESHDKSAEDANTATNTKSSSVKRNVSITKSITINLRASKAFKERKDKEKIIEIATRHIVLNG